MKCRALWLAALALAGLGATRAAAPHDLVHRYWPASFITAPGASPHGYGVYHFRKTIELPAAPRSFVVHVSADNRYHVFVNGTPVSRGPARGDPMHWRYDTLDLAQYLRVGRNVLAAEVWNAGESKPWAQMSVQTGFLVQGDSAAEDVVDTNATWLVARDPSRTAEPIDRAALHTFIVSGDGDRVDGSRYPWGWETVDFDDHAWAHATKAGDAVPYGHSTDVAWWLVPNQLPPMQEHLQRLARVRRSEGGRVPDAFVDGRHPLVVPAHATVTFLLDQGFETNAYPLVTVSGGKAAAVKLTYAEALVDAHDQKGNRDQIEGRRVLGKSDTFRPDGGDHRTFSTLWFRTYRYIEVTATTADDPLTLLDIAGAFTGYPFERHAEFSSNDPRLTAIWDVGWRTARLCAHETYFDCPYYEQLQYIGDTRIQALISLNVAGDDRLVRNAIDLFDQSRFAAGLTLSRYPASSPQVINTFSLFWVEMLRDYWMHRDDPAFIAPKLVGARNVLDWFIARIDPNTGLLGPLPYWTFVDWPDQWPWSETNHIGGEPPGAHEGGSAIVSLQLAMTLRDAAELFEAFGQAEQAAHYRQIAAALNRQVLAQCWDNARQLVADTPIAGKTRAALGYPSNTAVTYSQHANVLAVLSGAVNGDAARDLIARTASDPTLTPCTYYFRFYLLRAMKRAGLGDRYVASLGPWFHMLSLGLTTFAEKEEPTRSDCHAWSASPCYEFLATVCGIEPGSPGFKTVRIEPHLGELTAVRGKLPTGSGDVLVRFTREGNKLDADITLPTGKTGEFLWGGRRTALHDGAQHLSLR